MAQTPGVQPRRLAIVAAYAAVLVVYINWQTEHLKLRVASYDYDEGVYAQTAWAVQRGHLLFEEIFSSQPPLVPWLLAAVYTVTGPSAAAARVVIVALSLAGLIGVGLLAARGGGWVAGLAAVALLALSPQFGELARTISPGLPATALAALAVGLAGRYAGGGSRAWWIGAAVVFAAATLAKLIAVLVLPALGLLLLAAHGWRPGAVRSVVVDAALLALPLALGWGAVFWLFDPAAVLDQLVVYHADAKVAHPLDLGANLSSLAGQVDANRLLWILATLGIGALWVRRQRLLLAVCLAWWGSVVAALATHSPVLGHHLVLLLPPAAVLGGVGLSTGLSATRYLFCTRPVSRATAGSGLAVACLAVALTELPQVIQGNLNQIRDAEPTSETDQAIASIRAKTRPGSAIVSDSQMIALAADRPVPPALVDTSLVRIEADYLTTRDVQAVIERERPAAILFWSGRFNRLPGLREWVERRYRHEDSFGRGQDLYVARP